MKRNLYASLAVAAVLALCLGLVGCGGSSGTSASSGAAASAASSSAGAAESAAEGGFAGTWMLSSMDDLDEDGLAQMLDSGYGMFFVLQEDGTASYEFLGLAVHGTYQPESDAEASLALEDEDNWKDKMYLEDGTLKVESIDGGFAYFTRITEAEHQEYNDEYGYDPESESSTSGKSTTSGDAASSSASSGKATKEINKTIVDDDLCTIKVLDVFDDDDAPGYNVEITNKSDRTLTFMTGGRSGSNTVDGEEVSFVCYEEVDAGKTVPSEFQYWASDLGGGTEKLVNVKGVINVNDMSIPDTIATYEFEL